MSDIISKLNDGGPFFTFPIFLLFFVVLALLAKELLVGGNQKKTSLLIIHLGWFALAWGLLGRTFGLISAFDTVQAVGELSPHLLAGGLKMALIDVLMGAFVFATARISVIVLTLKTKEEDIEQL